jgi:hypothetical protein
MRNGIQIFYNNWTFERAKFWFWPIVFGVTIFFGFFDGIKGAFVGFMYGIIAGLFLIHESMAKNKKE